MKKWRGLSIGVALISAGILATFFIPMQTNPSGDTRIILEHSVEKYIAPRCFEQSNPSNFIEDSTLEKANEINYGPHSECTIQALESEENSLFIHVLKNIGLLNKKWDNW